MAPTRFACPNPRASECVTTQDKRGSEDVTKDLEIILVYPSGFSEITKGVHKRDKGWSESRKDLRMLTAVVRREDATRLALTMAEEAVSQGTTW